MVFNVTQANPYITTARGTARLIRVDACQIPMPIQNQFYEYLDFGDGTWPKTGCSSTAAVCHSGPTSAFRRNRVCTLTDLPTPGYGLRFTTSEASDAGRRILVACRDQYGNIVRTLDGISQVNGLFTTLAAPFADMIYPGTVTLFEISEILGIQKDTTLGIVSIYAVNLTTGAQTLIHQMEPTETVAAYSRYYLSGIPDGCCPTPGVVGSVQVTAMVKLDLVPCAVPSDYLLIQSREAILEECQAIRLFGSDSRDAKGQAAGHHRQAVGILQGQLVLYEGKNSPAVSFRPWGWSRLERQGIGTLQ
jgi:hypothetical protein